jgi:hypothetical protein
MCVIQIAPKQHIMVKVVIIYNPNANAVTCINVISGEPDLICPHTFIRQDVL